MKLGILIVQNISTTANFLNCRTILFFSYAFCVTIKRTRTASQQVLQHTTQYACLSLNQQAGKTNLKNTNMSDIKHKWEYFQSLKLFQTRSPEDGFIELQVNFADRICKGRCFKSASAPLVCHTAVFSVVTQRSSPLFQADLATERERQLTTGKSANRLPVLNLPLC